MSGQKPRDAQVFEEMLESMGVKEHEPHVVLQLLDFMYRYVAEVLQDADAYSERYSKRRSELSREDVLLSIQAREGVGEAWKPDSFAPVSFVQPPAQSVLNKLAAKRNEQRLPGLGKKAGLRLPPDGDCLLAPNYQLQPPKAAGQSHSTEPSNMLSQPDAEGGPAASSPAEPTALTYSVRHEQRDASDAVVQQDVDWAHSASEPIRFQVQPSRAAGTAGVNPQAAEAMDIDEG